MPDSGPGLAPLVFLRPTTPADLEFILGAENAPDNKPFIFRWSAQKPLTAFSDPTIAHIVVETAETNPRPAGYAIVNGLQNPHRGLALMRFVITGKGRGFRQSGPGGNK